MKRYNFSTLYGSYGYIRENDDKTAYLEIIWNASIPIDPHKKTYKNLHGAKIALGRLCESYTLKEA